MHSAKIICDSISPDGVRLTTMEICIPRIVLAELNTHRQFSRNSASSRAIPSKKMLQMVRDNPYIPFHWGKNQKGMQAEQELSTADRQWATLFWKQARNDAMRSVEAIRDIGVHKQITNRLLEPFMWHTVIITATEWNNFFWLRNNKMAHPDLHRTAKLMQEVYENNEPDQTEYDQWHLPYIAEDEGDLLNQFGRKGCADQYVETLIKLSVARCARVSYLTHDGKRDLAADIALHDRLLDAGHMSPFEHVATPMHPDPANPRYLPSHISAVHAEDSRSNLWSGNFRGWIQYRKTIAGEDNILAHRGDK